MNISIEAYKRREIVLVSEKTYENPFMDVDIDAEFTHTDGTVITLPGFWNGDNEWKVRFSFEKAGTWTYKISCTDKENSSLCDEGTIEVTPCLNPRNDLEKHGYVRLEKGKRYMVYNDGTPFFYFGDTHWMMPDFEHLHKCNYPDCNCGNQFKHIADDRIKKGFNVYQTYFSGARTTTSISGAEPWWTDTSYTKINPKAFNETSDIMFEYLAENGITISLGFGTHYSTVRSYKQNVTAMKAFARYCVARYACFPLIWITAQEITNYSDNAFDCWKQVGAYVEKLDGYKRPNGAHMHVHAAHEKRSVELNKEPWHQWWTLQGGHGGHDHLQHRSFYESYYKHDSGKIFIETECQYEDIHCSGFCGHDAPRMGAWNAVLSGSAGFTYGVTGIWVSSWHQKYAPSMVKYSPDSWFTGVDKEGSWQVSYMKKFFEYVKWYELEPSFDFSLGNFEDRSHVSIAHKGQELFVYYFYAVKARMGGYLMGLKPNVKYQARWFDPICNKFIDLEDIISTDGTAQIPPIPSKRDWVLLLNTEDLGAYESYVYPEWIQPIPASEAKLGEMLPIVNLKATSEDEDHPASNLIDGNPETYWMPFAPQTSQTLIADLGEAKEVGYLHFECNMENMRWIQFRIFGSVDGEHYDILTERNFLDVATGGRFPKYYDPISGKYRFIKLFINSTDLPDSLELTTFAIYTKAE